MINRRVIVAILLVTATGIVSRLAASPSRTVPDLSRVPSTIGAWRGQDSPLDEDVVRQLGADSYVDRVYTADGALPIELYVAYYAGQTPGGSIHSPLNCLPGTGWEPTEISTLAAPAAGAAVGGTLRRMLVRKDDQQALVLYWYQVHGRMLASEWDSKRYLLFDSVRLHRSDAGFVRIVAPVVSDPRTAETEGLAFARAVTPSIDRLWSQP